MALSLAYQLEHASRVIDRSGRTYGCYAPVVLEQNSAHLEELTRQAKREVQLLFAEGRAEEARELQRVINASGR